MAGDSNGRSALQAPLGPLRDQIIDLYLAWREETAAVADAYARWAGAPTSCHAVVSAPVGKLSTFP
jgi:hypothetical protein